MNAPHGLIAEYYQSVSRLDEGIGHLIDILKKAGIGVDGIADDVIVHGKDRAAHDDALHRLMSTASQHGLVFRREKCSILCDSVTFFGLIWSKDGVKPDPLKCDNIRNRPHPTNQKELQSFLV